MSQEVGITVGNAAKIATELLDLQLKHNVADEDVLVDMWSSLHGKVTSRMLELGDAVAAAQPPTFQPVPALQSAFPGSVVEQAPPAQTIVAPGVAPVVQLPTASPFPVQQPAAAPAPAPAAIPGVKNQGPDPKLEGFWQQFFADVNNGTWDANWEDNRERKASGGKFANIPDFKHKSLKDGKYNVGLYISDKKNPAWVAESLRSIGVAVG